MKPRRKAAKPAQRAIPSASDKAEFAVMIEEATVDAHDESEQATGWFTMFEQNLDLPFETEVLGVPVAVTSFDLRGDDQIVATCVRGRQRQAILVVDLPLPSPRPDGAEWIDAYRYWRTGR